MRRNATTGTTEVSHQLAGIETTVAQRLPGPSAVEAQTGPVHRKTRMWTVEGRCDDQVSGDPDDAHHRL